jgi:FkbM family methyltransferase
VTAEGDPGDRRISVDPVPIEALPLPPARGLFAAGGGRRAIRRLLAAGDDRRAVARDALFRAAEAITPSLVVEADGVRFHLNTADKEISRIVFIFGLYDRPLMHAAFSVLRELGGPSGFDGKKLLDVGANIGTTTLTACAHFGAGGSIAFEPDPTNLRFLRLNLADNGLDDRVDVHGVAVADSGGSVWLERSGYNAGDHRVRAEPSAAVGEPLEVPAVALDDLVGDGRIEPGEVGAAWLDVQGYEGHVLSGAQRLLEAGVPVVAEFWPHGLRESGGFENFLAAVAEHYPRVADLGRPQDDFAGVMLVGGGELEAVAERYGGEDDHTDLLLVPPRASAA